MSDASDTNITNCGEFASLTEAIAANSTTAVASLLKAGANVNDKDRYGNTALTSSNSGEMTSLLLEAGADINARDNWSRTALMCSDSADKMVLLLEAGAGTRRDYINAKDNYGRTALMLCNTGEMPLLEANEMTTLLIAAGADVNAKDDNGRTALMYSKFSKITSLLLEAGADVNAKDNLGNTPLMPAIKTEDEKRIQCLLAHGADANVKNEKGKTVLDAALQRRDPSLATLILAAGAKPEKEDRIIQQWLESPHQGKKEKVALLLAAGACYWLNLPTELGPTPQDLADAGERLRDVRAELSAERSRVSLRAIRGRAVQVCIALRGLDLPALVTLHILEELDEKARSVRMGALWALIVVVKHSRRET